IKLYLAQGSTGDALTAAEQVLDLPDLQHSPRYAWPQLGVSARACGVAVTSRAGAGDDLHRRAQRLLGRRRALAGTMDVAGPLQQAHQLTYAAEFARAASAPAGDALAAWDAAVQAWDHLDCPYALGRALLAAAEAAMECGDRAGAAERLARAAPLADGITAVLLREQIESLARRARPRLPARATRRPA